MARSARIPTIGLVILTLVALSCRAGFALFGGGRVEDSFRVWGYLDKKFPRIAAEKIPNLHGPSTLPNCAAAFFLPKPDRQVGWFVRELTFFPGDDGTGRPLVTENASWEFQLRRLRWEHRPDAERESREFLDEVFPLEFEQAIRAEDPTAADWVRIDVPGPSG